nr:hypothetical protein K-LCC10_0251 [Kaumoebavirus]
MTYNFAISPQGYLDKVTLTSAVGIFIISGKPKSVRPKFEAYLKSFPEETFVVGRTKNAYFAIPWGQALRELYFQGRSWENQWKLMKNNMGIAVLELLQVPLKGKNAIQAFDVEKTFKMMVKSHHRQGSNPEKEENDALVKTQIAELSAQLEKLKATLGK